MASKRPSFLKKLKEQQRKTRAAEKREAKRARQLAKTANPSGADPDLADSEFGDIGDLMDTEMVPGEGTDSPGTQN